MKADTRENKKGPQRELGDKQPYIYDQLEPLHRNIGFSRNEFPSTNPCFGY